MKLAAVTPAPSHRQRGGCVPLLRAHTPWPLQGELMPTAVHVRAQCRPWYWLRPSASSRRPHVHEPSRQRPFFEQKAQCSTRVALSAKSTCEYFMPYASSFLSVASALDGTLHLCTAPPLTHVTDPFCPAVKL